MNCAQTRQDLGVYLLGMLDPDERVTVDHHLAGCDGCRRELDELADVPPILDRLAPADVAALITGSITHSAAPTPDQTERLHRLLDRAAADRRRRRRLLALAAAVLIVVLSGLTVLLAMPSAPQPAPPGQRQAVSWSAADPATGIRAAATMSGRPWGTAITLDLHRVPAGTECTLLVVPAGRPGEPSGSWRADYAGGARITTATGTDLAQIRSLVIVDADGHQLLRLTR